MNTINTFSMYLDFYLENNQIALLSKYKNKIKLKIQNTNSKLTKIFSKYKCAQCP
uniref:Uncharacterized protein n=1 Tax=Solanum lycopersicum TaxID=4081 RepID=A0A3Q7EWP4_SOLLC